MYALIVKRQDSMLRKIGHRNGCHCFDAKQIYAQLETLINPEREIPETSIAIHHITPEMVKDKPTINQVLPEILQLIGTAYYCGPWSGI